MAKNPCTNEGVLFLFFIYKNIIPRLSLVKIDAFPKKTELFYLLFGLSFSQDLLAEFT
jgi:hypothetical protein